MRGWRWWFEGVVGSSKASPSAIERLELCLPDVFSAELGADARAALLVLAWSLNGADALHVRARLPGVKCMESNTAHCNTSCNVVEAVPAG